MTGRKKLPEGCWVTAFSSMLPAHAADSGMNSANAGRYRTRDVSEGLLAGARRSRALLTRAAPSPARRLDRVRARRKARQAQHLVTQELFKDALAREVRRADRFDEPFTLLVVKLNGAASSVVAQAMWSALGETAVVGWFSAPTVLAAVVPQPCVPNAEAQVRRELRRSLDAASLLRCSIRSHHYTPNFNGTPAWDTADPQLPSGHLVGSEHRRPADYRSKRALDLAGSLALLCALAPVFIIVAAIVKLTSKGQVLFRQKRVGQMGKPFTMLKFRTMRVDADHTLHHQFVSQFIQASAQADGSGMFKLTNDPRVTPIGRVLRKTSLDELPQLWNVVRGDMSLVGPRPPLPYEVEQYRPWHWRRVLDAKPGVTGLWQVVGRSRTTFDEMVRLDLRYVRTCSLWTDLKILLATPGAVISGNGAA